MKGIERGRGRECVCVCVRISKAYRGKKGRCVLPHDRKRKKGRNKERGSECVVGQAKQKRERGSVCVCVRG